MTKLSISNAMRVVLAALTLSACEAEIIGPELPDGCDRVRACQVRGVDLVVETPRLLLPANQPKDPASGRPILQPNEEFSVVISVWNRGDTTSREDTLSVYADFGTVQQRFITIPPLAPGDVLTDTVVGSAPSYHELQFRSDSAHVYAQLSDWLLDDPIHGNDDARSASFMVAAPLMEGTLMLPDTIRAGLPVAGRLTLKNVSKYGAFPAQAMAYCIGEAFDVTCDVDGVAAFNLSSVPAIAPGASWSTDIVITVPYSAKPRYYTTTQYIIPCMLPPGAVLSDFVSSGPRQCIYPSKPVQLRGPS